MIMRNKINSEFASRRMIVQLNVMEDQAKSKLDLEYANVIVLKTLMMYAMSSADRMLRRHHLQQMARFKFMILLLRLRKQLQRKFYSFSNLFSAPGTLGELKCAQIDQSKC